MFRKDCWLRPIVALLIVSLLPVANLAGFALQPAGAQGSEPIPGMQPLTVYVFGPTDPIDLKFYNETKQEPVEPGPSAAQGEGYWAYTILAHPDEAFSLSADGYLLSNEGDFISGEEQWDYVVHAVETEFAVNLGDYDFRFDPYAKQLNGYFRFRGVGEWGNYAVTVITDVRVYEGCDEIYDDFEMGDEFTCALEEGETPLQVRIDYVTANGYAPTNAAVNLQYVGLPEVDGIQDTDPQLGSAAPFITFTGPPSSDIALYKIVPPVRYDEMEPAGVKYIPATGGLYSALLEAFEAYPGDRITIRMVDRNGHEYYDALDVPIVDSMTSGQDGLINYYEYGCNSMTLSYSPYYYCEYAVAHEHDLEHDDAEYVDGAVTWTLPGTAPYIIVAYDLYFAQGPDFKGFARVNIDPDLQTFSHPVTNIPPGADRMAVVPLLVYIEDEGYPYAIVHYAEPFYITLPDLPVPQQPALEPPKVNGEYATQNEDDPSGFSYLAFVDKDAVSATVAVSSPNGEIWINYDVPLGSGGEYTVVLDGPWKQLTIVVRSPEDPDIVTVYFLTIYKGTDPVIGLTSHVVIGNTVYLNWLEIAPPGQQYQVEIELFRIVDNEPVPVESHGLEQYPNFAKLSPLDPATYKVVVRMVHNGQVLASDDMTFEIPEPKPMHLYVFGPDEVLSDLQITGAPKFETQHDVESVEWTHDEGNGYVRYTILAKTGYCYSLNHDIYRFNTPDAYGYCADEGAHHIVHATESAYDAHLKGVGMYSWLDGNLQGHISFTRVGNYEDYELVIVDNNGDEHACTVQENYGTSSMMFHCPDYSEAKSKYLRINALVGQGPPVPTNAAARLDMFNQIKDIILYDGDPAAGSLDLTVRFQSIDETDVSLYQIEVPGYPLNGDKSFVEAKGDDNPYIVHFGSLATRPANLVFINAYDRDGYLYPDFKGAGIIDVMTEQEDWINYEAICDTGTLYCTPVEAYGEFPGHGDGSVVSEDDGTGTGTFVRWTLPFSYEIYPVAYDLYYADSEKDIIRGEARVNLYTLTGEFRHPLSQAPELAEYVAVVPILRVEGNYSALYHADPFYVPLDATATPDLIVSADGMIRLEDGSYGYVPRRMTVDDLLSRFNVVAGAIKQIVDQNGEPLYSNDPVETGAKLALSKDGVMQTITLRFVYEAMGKSASDPVTIADIAMFIIRQLNSTNPRDLTGDGKFDSSDTRLLLQELAE